MAKQLHVDKDIPKDEFHMVVWPFNAISSIHRQVTHAKLTGLKKFEFTPKQSVPAFPSTAQRRVSHNLVIVDCGRQETKKKKNVW